MFLFADSVVSADCFNTTRDGINAHSSYLDLQPIYGTNTEEQMSVRTGSQGMLHPDTFYDRRIALMNPATTALAVMYCRNHNYIAKKLFELNERSAYENPATLSEEDNARQDEDIFQRARLINCGYYVHVVLCDYIPAILNQMGNTEWFLNPLDDMRNIDGSRIDRATGNQVSAEFDLVYRWHNTISRGDENWLVAEFQESAPGRDPATLTWEEFYPLASQRVLALGAEPKVWVPHKWERNADGSFDDAMLAKTLMDATQEVAGAFGARQVPSALRLIESLGIQRSRQWALSSLNEFRVFLGLEPHKTFLEWNNDPSVAAAAESLYGHVDNMELFPGLVAEQPKPSMPGSGLCPGMTISRGILSDAANLIRGDRFYTQDFSTGALTTWGFGYATNMQPGIKKGVVAKMLFNNLPQYYSHSNSVYALFPFVTPERMKQVLKKQGVARDYNFDRPGAGRKWAEVTSYTAVSQVLMERASFTAPHPEVVDMGAISRPPTIKGITIDLPVSPAEHRIWLSADTSRLQPPYLDGFEQSIRTFFATKTRELIEKNSQRASNGVSHLDVVRSITNIVFPAFVSAQWAIPLRDDLGGVAGWTVQELFMALSAEYAHALDTFADVQPGSIWLMENTADRMGKILHAVITARVLAVVTPGFTIANKVGRRISSLLPNFGRHDSSSTGIFMSDASIQFYKSIIKKSPTLEDAATQIHGLAISFCVTQAQQLAQIIDFYLREENSTYLERLTQLSRQGQEADDEILGYLYEAMRFVGQAAVVPRLCTAEMVVNDAAKQVRLHPGMGVFASQQQANMDPSVFSSPEKIDPRRERSKYLVCSQGLFASLGRQLTDTSLLFASRAVFSLPNLRRAPGVMGCLTHSYSGRYGTTPVPFYLTEQGVETPFPTSLCMLFG